MKISLVSEKITVIELSPEEMSHYDFTFEKSDYSSPHTRRVLWSIIDDAARIAGKSVEISRGLEIDFLPDIKGGGLLIISEGDDSIKGHKLHGTRVFEADSLENITGFAKSCMALPQCPEAELYCLEGSYRLILHSPNEHIFHLAGEFNLCELDSPYIAEGTRESHRCILKDKALAVLGGLAS